MAIRKIVWPIHPSESSEQIDRNICHFIRELREHCEFELLPVCVISTDYVVTSEYFQPVDLGMLKGHLRNDCVSYLSSLGFSTDRLEILENHTGSQRGEVAVLADFVEDRSADYVVLASHGRKGWSRAFLGSFTENFLLMSTVPVFVVGPNYQSRGQLDQALLPTEISDSSKSFISALGDSENLDFLKSLRLFHKVSMVDLENVAWAPSLYGIGSLGTTDVIELAKASADKFLKSSLETSSPNTKWAHEISDSLESLQEVVAKAVDDSDAGLLIVRSESGFFATNVLGSVTRQMIRESKVPVLIYPHSCREIG